MVRHGTSSGIVALEENHTVAASSMQRIGRTRLCEEHEANMASYLYRCPEASVARQGQEELFLSRDTYSALRHGYSGSECAIYEVLY